MSDNTMKPTTAALTSNQNARSKGNYVRPQLTELGPWKQMTLIYSLPIGPGGYGYGYGVFSEQSN